MMSCIDYPPEALRAWLVKHHLWEALEASVTRPFCPLPDNFTPPTRTPWGGTKILRYYKSRLPIRQEKQYAVVGESWELSTDPTIPSHLLFELQEDTILLSLIQLVELFPERILGKRIADKFERRNPLLLKLLDAADNLSVQVHPANDYARLRTNESGKPECWYILEAEPGSGLYFGLQEHVSKAQLRKAIETREDVSRYLNFVEVHPGDFFNIEAGTIHAIGAGVTLIEPQKIMPQRSGKTYRLWDWNRLYDKHGQCSTNGHSRELHVEESLEVITFDGLRGDEFIQSIQPTPQCVQRHGDSQEIRLIENEHFGVSNIVLHSEDELSQECVDGFHGLFVYRGALDIQVMQQEPLHAVCGQSVIVPADACRYTLKSQDAQTLKMYYPPQYA